MFPCSTAKLRHCLWPALWNWLDQIHNIHSFKLLSLPWHSEICFLLLGWSASAPVRVLKMGWVLNIFPRKLFDELIVMTQTPLYVWKKVGHMEAEHDEWNSLELMSKILLSSWVKFSLAHGWNSLELTVIHCRIFGNLCCFDFYWGNAVPCAIVHAECTYSSFIACQDRRQFKIILSGKSMLDSDGTDSRESCHWWKK